MTSQNGEKVKWGTVERVIGIGMALIPLVGFIYDAGQNKQAFNDLKETIAPYIAQTNQLTKDVATIQGALSQNYSSFKR